MMNMNPYALLANRVGRVGAGDVGPAMAPPQYLPGLSGPIVPWGGGGMVPGPAPCPTAPYGYGGCYPYPGCGPQSPDFYRQAARSAVAAHTPQTGLGISSAAQSPGTVIGAGLSRTLFASPSVPLCITQFIVSRPSAPLFEITSIQAARIEYLSDGQPIPADDFAPDSLVRPIRMPQLYPGTQVSVGVTNISTNDAHFRASFYGLPGPSCEPCI